MAQSEFLLRHNDINCKSCGIKWQKLHDRYVLLTVWVPEMEQKSVAVRLK
jgi:hypothetical protein